MDLLAATPQHLPGLIGHLAPTIEHWGYGALALLVLVEDFGIPVPGETALIAAAFLAGIGHLNIFLVGVVAFAAAVVGDNIGFAIGHFGGHPLVNRWGKYVLLTPERLTKAERFFNRHGGKMVVIARFVEGLRQLNGIIAGISEMRWPRFLGFNALGAALWVAVWASAGYFGGNHLSAFHRYEFVFSAIVGALIIGWIAFAVWKIVRANQNKKHQPPK